MNKEVQGPRITTFPSVKDIPRRRFQTIQCGRCSSLSHIDILSHAGWFYCFQCGKRFYNFPPNDPDLNRATEELLNKWLDVENWDD